MSKPLDGIRVLDVSSYVFVPAAGAILADWGAEVIRVENPAHADPIRSIRERGLPNEKDGLSFRWEQLNRGKHGIGIDMSKPEARPVLDALVRTSDVFLTNMLPPARKRFGIDVDDVRRVNPRIVYARGSGQGPAGPESNDAGFDTVAFWARSGAAHQATPDDRPAPAEIPSLGFGDNMSGIALAGGVAAALAHRERSNEALVVDVSLLGTAMWGLESAIVPVKELELDQMPRPARTAASEPLWQAYRTADGRFILLTFQPSDRYWPGFCEVAAVPELATDPRLATAAARSTNSAYCVDVLDELFATKTLEEWIGLLAQQRGVWAVVSTPAEVHHDPQVLANGYLREVHYPDDRRMTLVSSPVQFDGGQVELSPAPDLGADTDAILSEAGFDSDEVDRLRAAGAVQ